jgi:hypothetical protein
MICASYEFLMTYDSLCEVSYKLTEWKRNGTPLRMPEWRDERTVNAAAGYLGFNSRTAAFTCKTGDTLSFFRWFRWNSLIPGHNDVEGYAALDTLDYAVELVRTSDSTRVALLDSLGALPRAIPGRPHIYGSRPFMAMVQYAVPSTLDGEQAFMRIRLYHRGSGPYWFTRYDASTSNLSGFMRKPWYASYIKYYAQDGLMKQVRERAGTTSSAAHLRVMPDGGNPRNVSIRFDAAPPGVPTSIMVCDISGRFLFYPMLWEGDADRNNELHYQFEQSGAYLVALLYQDRIQEVVRWNVTN